VFLNAYYKHPEIDNLFLELIYETLNITKLNKKEYKYILYSFGLKVDLTTKYYRDWVILDKMQHVKKEYDINIQLNQLKKLEKFEINSRIKSIIKQKKYKSSFDALDSDDFEGSITPYSSDDESAGVKHNWYTPGNEPQNNIFDILLTSQDFKVKSRSKLNNNARQQMFKVNNSVQQISQIEHNKMDQSFSTKNKSRSFSNIYSYKNNLENYHYPEITYDEYLNGDFITQPIYIMGESYNQYIPKVRINDNECYFLGKSIKRSKKITNNYKDNILKWNYSFIKIMRLVI